MEAIAVLYDSDSSSSGDETAATRTARHVIGDTRPSTVAAAGGTTASSNDGDDSGDDATQAASRKRRRQLTDSPPTWKRAFAHVDGNWPSHVKVDIAFDDEVEALVKRTIDGANTVIGDEVALVSVKGDDGAALHVSLSRPFVLTYNQIDAFVDALRAAFKWRTRFQAALGRAIVLVNDDASRSFLALEIGAGASHLVNLIKCVDKCMREFGLQPYYEDPIPHVSIASALGNSLRGLLPQAQLNQLGSNPGEDDAECVPFRVTSVQVVIGNKHFHIPLR